MTAAVIVSDEKQWRIRAACRNVPLEIFYPSESRPGAYDLARGFCAICSVGEACAEAGRGEALGMWAGATPAERAYGARHRV